MSVRRLLPVHRRGALASLAAAALAGVAGPPAGPPPVPRWPAVAGDPAAARIAEAYLRRFADGRERLAALERRLVAEGGGGDAAAAARAWLARARRADFAAGDVLVLEGWVLARSEAELITLAALG